MAVIKDVLSVSESVDRDFFGLYSVIMTVTLLTVISRVCPELRSIFFSRGGNCRFFKRFFLSIVLSDTLLLLLILVLVLDVNDTLWFESFFFDADDTFLFLLNSFWLFWYKFVPDDVLEFVFFCEIACSATVAKDGDDDGNEDEEDDDEDDDDDEEDGGGEKDEVADEIVAEVIGICATCVATIFGLIFGLRVDVPLRISHIKHLKASAVF